MYKVNSKIQTIAKRLPLMAAILGAGLAMAQNSKVSFHSQDTEYAFRYDSNDYSADAVSNRNNWVYTTSSTGCDDENEVACTMIVPASSVDISGSNVTLKSSFVITTGYNATTGTYYVDSQSEGSHVNKSN